MKLLDLLCLSAFAFVPACAGADPSPPSAPAEPRWTSLFDGQSLGAWRPTRFGGEGAVEVEGGRITMDFGSPLTGITWSGEFPTSDYELYLEAERVDGNDFFCGLTFPAGEGFCTLVLGGWGGSVVGLSCIDGEDASENETTDYVRFESGKVYAVRLRVSATHIRAWLDGEPLIDQEITGRWLSLRPEVELSKPLGIAAFATRAALADIRYRRLEPQDRSSPPT